MTHTYTIFKRLELPNTTPHSQLVGNPRNSGFSKNRTHSHNTNISSSQVKRRPFTSKHNNAYKIYVINKNR